MYYFSCFFSVTRSCTNNNTHLYTRKVPKFIKGTWAYEN